MHKKLMLVLTVLLISVSGLGAAEWVDLFDGESIDGWIVRSGTNTYRVEDGTIVGTVVEGSPNTFLCTQKEYGDFILEFEVKVDTELNSGVQFRSLVAGDNTVTTRIREGKEIETKLPKDRVYGYQVEIAASPHAGNVYDEARRAAFLDDFEDNPAAQKAFKDKEWNHYRVECRGDRIRTWVNGIAAADFTDSVTAKGIIGLQVHGLSRNFAPYEVRWRNIRIQELP